MKYNLSSLSPEQNNALACALGEIQRHLAEDTDLLDRLAAFDIDLSKEIDGYDCLITALYQLQQHADKNV